MVAIKRDHSLDFENVDTSPGDAAPATANVTALFTTPFGVEGSEDYEKILFQ